MMRLSVELDGTSLGVLEGGARDFDLVPDAAGMERFGINSTALSVAIPLAPRLPRHHAGRRRNWFAELLPEGDLYDHMLLKGGLARGDVLGFLARYGRDVAGALQIWDLDDPTEPRTPTLRAVTESEIAHLLRDPIGSPLGNTDGGGKSSLGGVQPKVVLTRMGEGWAQALGGYPTSHILKPELAGDLRSVIYDEEYGTRLSRGLGLAEHPTWIEEFSGVTALVVERYDRDPSGGRIHQEDFNQVLGASRNEKYQEIGGVVSLRRVAESLVRSGAGADLPLLAKMLTFAVAIGNFDMHSKNLALLHPVTGRVQLAPAYDVVPHSHLPGTDGRMAMSVSREYRHGAITLEHLTGEVHTWGLKNADLMLREFVAELEAVIQREVPLSGSSPRLQADVARFARNLATGRPVAAGS